MTDHEKLNFDPELLYGILGKNSIPREIILPSDYDLEDSAFDERQQYIIPNSSSNKSKRLVYKPPMQPGRVNFDELYRLGNVIIEPVPEDQRARYRYWRGAHLGKIAMNFARGIKNLNAGQDPVIHFADTYDYALNRAGDASMGIQFTEEDAAELAKLTDEDPARPLPTIVFALDDRYNDIYLPPSRQGAGHGIVYEGFINASMIDEYSRNIVEGIALK